MPKSLIWKTEIIRINLGISESSQDSKDSRITLMNVQSCGPSGHANISSCNNFKVVKNNKQHHLTHVVPKGAEH